MGPQYQSDSDDEKILYVIFHGDLVFTDFSGPGYIRVRSPQIHEHVFMAGPWLAERHIPMGAMLELKGVELGGDTIHSHTDQFVIFQNAPGNPEAMPYFEILLPRPDAILPGALFSFLTKTLVIDTPYVTFEVKDPTSETRTVDLRPIFQYRVKQGCQPGLSYRQGDGDTFPKWPASEGQLGYYSLHIFAEADQDFGAGHSQMSFRESAKLLGVEADVEPIEDGRRRESERGDSIPGLLPDEYQIALRDRVVTVGVLGHQRQVGESLCWHRQRAPTQGTGDPDRTPFWLDGGSCGPSGNG